jgi:hypothetical protein
MECTRELTPCDLIEKDLKETSTEVLWSPVAEVVHTRTTLVFKTLFGGDVAQCL